MHESINFCLSTQTYPRVGCYQCFIDGVIKWKVFGLPTEDLTTIKVSMIHEDNAGALVLAQTIPPQFTPRSKYYAIKTVWFREECVKRGVSLLKIDTVEQLGDLLTKGVPKATFEYLRSKIMGW